MKKVLLLFCGLVVQVGGWAQRFELKQAEGQRYELTRAWDERADSVALRIVAPYRQAVDSVMSPVLGECDVYMRAGRPESLLSNFVADVLLDASVRAGKRADIGLCNIGGLRSAMPEGKVTYGDVLEIAPFENRLCILSLRGNKVQELMEQIAAVGGEGISGANLVITKDGRLLNAQVGGRPIDPKAIYVVATLDYLAEGNDRMYALKDHLFKRDTKFAVRDLIVEAVVRARGEGRKITAKIEDRIVKQ